MLAAPIRSQLSADLLADLNEAQRAAAEHGVGEADGPAPLLVIAGAGAGKTNTLAHRVAHLILNGADPKRIMLATFSRRAAAELNRRVERLLRRDCRPEAAALATPAYAGTFHAIGARLLREYADAHRPRSELHHPRPRGFRRPDEPGPPRRGPVAEGRALSRPRRPAWPSIPAPSMRASRSARRSAKRFPWAAKHEAALRELFAAYVEAKQRQGVLDYDDLLLYFAQMLAEPELAAEIAGRFDHLLVDEYQDTNTLQAEIALALRPGGRGLTVVGDDAQSIYSFRAATVRNILDFPTSSIRRRASSRWSAITARPRRSSPPPTP